MTLNNCLDEVHARILVVKNVDCRRNGKSACAPPDRTLTTVSLLASSCAWPREAEDRRHRTSKGAVGNLALSGRGVLIQEVLQ